MPLTAPACRSPAARSLDRPAVIALALLIGGALFVAALLTS